MKPASELMLTMAPRRSSIMSGRAKHEPVGGEQADLEVEAETLEREAEERVAGPARWRRPGRGWRRRLDRRPVGGWPTGDGQGGVVDEDVDGPELGVGPGHDRLDLVGVGEIGGDGYRSTAG